VLFMTKADPPVHATEMLTLGIDIGGSHLKCAVLHSNATIVGDEVRVDTPDPATPDAVVSALADLVAPLPAYDRVSIGFPGVVRKGVVYTAPTLRSPGWNGYNLAAALGQRLGKPIRILNDASVQGLGAITGSGLECVLTMGTGMGFALFHEGRLAPHLEMSQHPVHEDKTYNEYVGNAALKAIGKKRWSKRMHKVIKLLATVVNYDVLYIGGGNARHIKDPRPENVKLVPNTAGITGGIRLWDERMNEAFSQRPPFSPMDR
jgi:polyphosphate glucokinase